MSNSPLQNLFAKKIVNLGCFYLYFPVYPEIYFKLICLYFIFIFLPVLTCVFVCLFFWGCGILIGFELSWGVAGRFVCYNRYIF